MSTSWFRFDDVTEDVLRSLEASSPWLVGGVVRNKILDVNASRDIDLVVEDSSIERTVMLASELFGSPSRNRHNNYRFQISESKTLDIWCPSRFYRGYNNVFDMLCHFDFTCNSVAYSRANGFIGHQAALDDIHNRLLRPIEQRWRSQSNIEYTHLVGRACRLIVEYQFSPCEDGLYQLAVSLSDRNLLDKRYGFSLESAKRILQLD